ncbi:hypothetical protein E8E12_003037 [Didymella heteroderae]|uniref:Inner centromere protein ARK-binding domain-containing protein n=1 Tax=Didymella heteroderae TaxID=1769908 RepID=A0A9P4WNZ8_9PLEO|nr:hypothetical protein E8E12_003037 [Didymella heteroderae]
MTASRSKVPAIGSAQWILEERHQSNDLVTQELEDFGFSVRNELEWLNEHMADIFAKDGQHNLDVFKTPGKLRGKTPHTTRKRIIAEPRQPLANLFAAELQQRTTPAEQSLRDIGQRSAVKSKFQIAEDVENEAPVESPKPPTPAVRQLFSKVANDDREHPIDSFDHELSDERSPSQPAPAQWASFNTQDTAFSSQANDIFSPPRTQTTQATQSFRYSMHDLDDEDDKDKDAPEDSFISAMDAFRSKTASNEDLREQAQLNDALLDEDFEEDMRTERRGTVVHHDIGPEEDEEEDMQDISHFPKPPRVVSDAFSIGAETHEALDTANHRAHAPEPKMLLDPAEINHSLIPAGAPIASPERITQNDMDARDDVENDMEVDEEPTPSEHSSPVKPLVRKSSLTFACLPAREPILPKKSMGRTSQIRHTGGKSLGASQIVQPVDSQHDDADMDEDRPALQREESETTKTHNKTSTQRLFERFQMLEQHAPPKRISQNLLSQSSRPSVYPANASQPKEFVAPTQTSQSQPTYPTLPVEPEKDEPEDEDDDDSWIAAPTKTTASAANPVRPPINKSHTVATHSSPHKLKPSPIKLVSTSNPDLSAAADSTTPVGSPVGKKYADAPLSASKAKFYSALRAAKDKFIGSTAASAQLKLDSLSSSPRRPELQPAPSSDDPPSSPKRAERPISLFSHMRSPSKDSVKSSKSAKSVKSEKLAEAPGSPVKERKTRSSTEREKAKEREAREKEMLHKQKSEDKLREMREKEQSKAAAYHKKTASAAAIAKTPSQVSSQISLKPAPSVNNAPKPAPRPDPIRLNSAPKDQGTDSADEMPPPPPPKSLLPTFPATKVRPPKKLIKLNSKDALAKPQEPQKIFIKNQYARAPPPAARPVPVTTKSTGSSTLGKSTSSKPTAATLSRPGTAMANKAASTAKSAPNTLKAPPPKASRPQPQAAASFEKAKPQAPQPRADLAAARVPTTLRTVQDANSIRVPPVNTAKPPKRALNDDTETIQRPPKRPSQLKQNPITPGHPSQYAKGKIPGLDSALASHSKSRQPSMQYPNGDDIKLPEIMTDSEDEDSDNEFEQPSWVNTPNLREMLSTQQLMDPEAIFGPIAPLNMEQVFPNKERHKRFRERTSSAYWVHDQVTDEEKRKEREARERLVREGAWTYNPSPRPTPRAGPSH